MTTDANSRQADVELRPFQPERDLPLLSGWLRQPHVARWWGEPEQAVSELRTRAPDTAAVILLAGRPVGVLCWQTPSRSELEDAGLADLPSDLVDVDILIGEPDALGRGVGPEALRRLFAALGQRGVRLVGLATSVENARSLAAAAKAGLLPYRDFVELGEHYRYFTRNLSGGG